jgi:hypothetical protein
VFNDFFGSNGVVKAMNQIYKTSGNTNEFDKFAAEYLDRFLANWKLGTTTARGPGFVVNNVMGGMWNNFLGGVQLIQAKRSGKAILAMGEKNIAKEIEEISKSALGKTMTESTIYELAQQNAARRMNGTVINGRGMGDLWLDFRALGGAEGSDTAALLNQARASGEALTSKDIAGTRIKGTYDTDPTNAADAAFRTTMDFLANNKLQRGMNKLAQGSESYLRFAAFLEGFERFGTAEAAMSMVHSILHLDTKQHSSSG